MYDFSLLPRLIQASGAMSGDQKKWLLAKLPELDEAKKTEIYKILENEQIQKHDLYQDMLNEKQDFENKRNKIIRSYIERRDSENEESEIAELDKELETA